MFQLKKLELFKRHKCSAIEADRSTEFKVLCSKEQVQKMKERKRQESENQKKKRAMEEERRKSKDKVSMLDYFLYINTRTYRMYSGLRQSIMLQ